MVKYSVSIPQSKLDCGTGLVRGLKADPKITDGEIKDWLKVELGLGDTDIAIIFMLWESRLAEIKTGADEQKPKRGRQRDPNRTTKERHKGINSDSSNSEHISSSPEDTYSDDELQPAAEK